MTEIAWTAYDPLERGSGNEDPLGFFAYAMRLADLWLPGITTRTRRLRYYSMVTAGLYLIEDEFGEEIRETENHDAERTKLFLRWERLWVYWNVAWGEGRKPGLIGREKAEDVSRPRTVDYPFIARQADLGALGSYRTSLESLGFLREDEARLTILGERLAGTFWDEAPRGTWGLATEILSSGRLPKSRGRLARPSTLGEVLSYESRGNSAALRAGMGLVRTQLLGELGVAGRRREVFQYLRANRLGAKDEHEILVRAAQGRGRSRERDLERRAAVIVTLEGYRKLLVDALNIFRKDLLARGGKGSPRRTGNSQALRHLVPRIKRAQARLRPFEMGEFAKAFQGFPLGTELCITDGQTLLRDLLRVHAREMESRRSPHWFRPAGGEDWELDPSTERPPEEDDPLDFYPYRTRTLLSLLRDARCRL